MSDPSTQRALLEQAIAHHNAGRLAEAEPIYRRILAANPNDPNALYLLGVLAHQAGHTAAGIDLLRRVIALRPEVIDAYRQLALMCQSIRRMGEALEVCRAGLRVQADDPPLLLMLGATLVDLRRAEESVEVWRRLIALRPKDVEAWANLGASLEMLGRLDEALAAARRAIEIDPKHAPAHVNAGAVLAKLGRSEQALAHDETAVRLAPELAAAHVNRGHVLMALGRLEEAGAAGAMAIRLDPRGGDGHRVLAVALAEMGRLEESLKHFDAAIRLMEEAANPSAVGLKLLRATNLPMLYDSVEEIERLRARLIANLKELAASGTRVVLEDEPLPTLFKLAYQGRDDRDIMHQMASLMHAPPLPKVTARPKSAGKMRVGFISRFFRDHTIGRLNRGLIANLSRDRFEVVVFSIGDHRDEIGNFIREHADVYVVLPPALKRSRELIAEQSLDVLYFTDVGMEGVTHGLAFNRFAPVQCATWGHPLSTGIDTVDYFISSEALEVPGSQSQYTEKLVKLRALSVYYYRPTTASTKSRADFGLPQDAMLYGCLQMLYKFHPDFDALIGGVLRRDSAGRVVITRGKSPQWDERLMRRFARTIPDVADRILFVPPQPYDDFLKLTSLCDVMLDPVHFGGGNTSYEALAFGVPVVTLPSNFLRGRITAAQYAQMGIEECVATSAENYVDIAVRLGRDRGFRAAMSNRILAAGPALFENLDGVRELETFLVDAVKAARGP